MLIKARPAESCCPRIRPRIPSQEKLARVITCSVRSFDQTDPQNETLHASQRAREVACRSMST
jgi:hypothetical protein